MPLIIFSKLLSVFSSILDPLLPLCMCNWCSWWWVLFWFSYDCAMFNVYQLPVVVEWRHLYELLESVVHNSNLCLLQAVASLCYRTPTDSR